MHATFVLAVVLSAGEVEEQPEPMQRTVQVRYAPGISAPSELSIADQRFGVGPAAWVHSPGVQVRFSRYFAVRADAELRQGAQTWHIPGIKLTGMPDSRVRPWISLSVALHQSNADPGRIAVGFMKAAGLDVTLFKYFFLTGEVRVDYVPGNCCTLPRVAGLLGAGAQFL